MRFCPRCRSVYAAPVAHCGLDGEKIVEQAKDPLIGEVLDRYRIAERIGEGGMGLVYRATHTTISREYAIKVLFGELASNATFVERMRREARAVSMMRHPNIVVVEDFGTTPSGIHFLVMELVVGRTLHSLIKREAPFTLERAASIGRQIAAALGEAHRLGFVHRDLKPSNIMIDTSGPGGQERVKVLDFGVVAQQERDETQAPLTAVGAIIGTPMYMAPEQSDSHFTEAVDLYSLGVILYEMIVGRPPFTGSPKELLKKHLADPPPPLGPSLGLEALVAALLEKSPKRRPGSAEDVIRVLDAIDFSDAVPGHTQVYPSKVPAIALASPAKPAMPASPPSPDVTEAGPTQALAEALHAMQPFEGTDKTLPEEVADPMPGSRESRALADDLVLVAPLIEAETIAVHAEPTRKNAPLLSKDRMPVERVRGQPIAAFAPAHVTPVPSAVVVPLSTLDIPVSGPALDPESRDSFARNLAIGGVVFGLAVTGGYFALARNDVDPAPLQPSISAPLVKTSTKAIAVEAPAREKRTPIGGPLIPVTPAIDPAISVLEVNLQQALTDRGLSIADLDSIPGAAPAAKRWREAGKEQKLEATRALLAEVERVQITASLLRGRLKRLNERFSILTGDARAERLSDLKRRHEHIAGLLRAAASQEDYLGLSLTLAILEDDTRRLIDE